MTQIREGDTALGQVLDHVADDVKDVAEDVFEDVFADVDIEDYVGVPPLRQHSNCVQWASAAFFCSAVGLFASLTWFLARRREPATVVPLVDIGLP